MLPDGLTTRSLDIGDTGAVFAVMAAAELDVLGNVEIEEADIVSDWQRPSFSVADSTVGVFDGTDLVGYAEVGLAGRGDAAVHPEWTGRGIGTFLAQWMQGKAQEKGLTEIGMPVPAGSPADHLLQALGYHLRWTSWMLQLPAGAAIPPRPLPDGFAIREATPDEHRAVWTVIEDAFLEWSIREREDFEDFEASITLRPGFEPWQLRVATDPSGAVVGTSVVMQGEEAAFVARLAVRKDLRGRGLAQALLADSFEQGRRHGATVMELSTDSRTGALSLYEKVGMVVTSTWVNRGISV